MIKHHVENLLCGTRPKPRLSMNRCHTMTLLSAIVFLYGAAGCAHPCASTSGQELRADIDAHRLYLCRDGEAEHTYPIASGRNGGGRRHVGDARTPVGVFPLAGAQPSRFFKRLPFGRDDKIERNGEVIITEVGVHGPSQDRRRWGVANVFADWTQGCLAVASNEQVTEIEQWRATHQADRVIIDGDARTGVRLNQGVRLTFQDEGGIASGYLLDANWQRRFFFADEGGEAAWIFSAGYDLTTAPFLEHQLQVGLGLGWDHGVAWGFSWALIPKFVVGSTELNDKIAPGIGFKIPLEIDLLDGWLAVNVSYRRLWRGADLTHQSHSLGISIDIALGHLTSLFMEI